VATSHARTEPSLLVVATVAPSSRNNDTVDSIGFDSFNLLVKCTYTKIKSELTVKIRDFETQARMRNGDSPHGFDALAMVMVDLVTTGKYSSCASRLRR
jgi:hypothetical protein